ncbi:hypothetical protein HaLaN_32392, partial [Haematococcus lacustris]
MFSQRAAASAATSSAQLQPPHPCPNVAISCLVVDFLLSMLTLMLFTYHQVKQNLKLSQPSNVVAGAVEGGAHHTGGALDASSPPTAPAQDITTSTFTTFTTSQSCHSLLDSVVVPHQPLECHA